MELTILEIYAVGILVIGTVMWGVLTSDACARDDNYVIGLLVLVAIAALWSGISTAWFVAELMGWLGSWYTWVVALVPGVILGLAMFAQVVPPRFWFKKK